MMANIFDWYPSNSSSSSASSATSFTPIVFANPESSAAAVVPETKAADPEPDAEEDFDDILDALNKLSNA